MTKVITYNNIQLSFQADTSGIKSSKSELAQLTREVNSHRTNLEKYMRKLEVIDQLEKKGGQTKQFLDDRIRAATRTFIEAEQKAGSYGKALVNVYDLVPSLSKEVANLAQTYQKQINTEKEAAALEQKKANRREEIIGWLKRWKANEDEITATNKRREKQILSAYVKEQIAASKLEEKQKAIAASMPFPPDIMEKMRAQQEEIRKNARKTLQREKQIAEERVRVAKEARKLERREYIAAHDEQIAIANAMKDHLQDLQMAIEKRKELSAAMPFPEDILQQARNNAIRQREIEAQNEKNRKAYRKLEREEAVAAADRERRIASEMVRGISNVISKVHERRAAEIGISEELIQLGRNRAEENFKIATQQKEIDLQNEKNRKAYRRLEREEAVAAADRERKIASEMVDGINQILAKSKERRSVEVGISEELMRIGRENAKVELQIRETNARRKQQLSKIEIADALATADAERKIADEMVRQINMMIAGDQKQREQDLVNLLKQHSLELKLQGDHLLLIHDLEKRIKSIKTQQLTPSEKRTAEIAEFRKQAMERAKLEIKQLREKASLTGESVSEKDIKRIFSKALGEVDKYIELLNKADQEEKRLAEITQNRANAEAQSAKMLEKEVYQLNVIKKNGKDVLVLQKQIVNTLDTGDDILNQMIQDEQMQNTLVARRMNMYRQMPSVISRSQGLMAGARQFAQGASMGGMPGGMLIGMHSGAIAGMAVVGGIVASIKAYKDLRDNLVLLESQFGNTTDAQATFLRLRQLAAKSPLETRDLMAGAVTLKQYGIANSEVMPTMEKLAAVSGGSAERLAGLTRAFAQTSSAGKLMGQEVLQFVNSGFNPLNEMVKRTNVSMLELRKMMENGLLSSQDMKDAFTSATQEGGQFHGQMAKQAEELSAKYNAMIDSLRQVGEAIGGFLELPTKGVMRLFTDLFTHTANQLNILGKSSKMIFSAAFDQQNFVQNQESMWIDLENTMIGYYAYLTKQDFGPAIQKQDNLFANFEKRRLEAIEKEAKAREKARLLIEDEIFGLTAAKDAQEEFNAILMTKSQLEQRDNAKKMEAFRLESERIANLKAQAEQISQPEGKRGSFQQILDKYMKEAQSEQENFSKILEKTPLAKAAREILDRSQQDFLKNNPQVAIMEQAQRIADMINGGMLTMQQGSAELARVMQENTNATQQQSYDLPRTLQAGTVEAYQAMFGRDNTAKLQLAEQKRQVAEQQKANGLLNDLLNKNPIKAMN